jgi:hypothetical protein
LGHGIARGRGGLQAACGGQWIGSGSTAQLEPNVMTVIGLASDTPVGHATLNGGAGLQVGMGLPGSPVGQPTLIAAMQPSSPRNTVHDACSSRGGLLALGGGLAITVVGGGGGW